MTEILTLLRDTWSLLFSSLVGGERRRSEVVVTLLAVLELVRLGRIRTQQTELFGEIVIEPQTGEAHAGSSCRLGGPALRVGHPARAGAHPGGARAPVGRGRARPRRGALRPLRRSRPPDRRGRRWLPHGHAPRVPALARAAHAVADEAASVATRARDAGDRRLQAAGVAPRGGRDPRGELRGRAREPARAAPHPHPGPQGRPGAAVPLRDHARVPRRLRAARPRRPAEGRGRAPGAGAGRRGRAWRS